MRKASAIFAIMSMSLMVPAPTMAAKLVIVSPTTIAGCGDATTFNQWFACVFLGHKVPSAS